MHVALSKKFHAEQTIKSGKSQRLNEHISGAFLPEDNIDLYGGITITLH